MKNVIMSEDTFLHMGFPCVTPEKEKGGLPCANLKKKPYICPKQIDNGKGTDNSGNYLAGGQEPKKKPN